MYWLTRFGTQNLSQYNVQFNAGPAPAEAAAVALVGGGTFDPYGTGVAPQRYPFSIRYQCAYVGDANTVRFNINLLKAAIGTRQKLWRTMIPGGLQLWCWARLTDIDDSMRSKIPQWVVPVTLNFAVMGRWNGLLHRDGWYFDSGLYFDDSLAFDSDDGPLPITASPQTFIVDNDGKLAVRDSIIYVTAGSAAITNLKIGVTGVSEIEYTGTIAAGTVLAIYCASKKVLNNGANAWNDLSMTGNHKIADWLVLQSGNNSVVVTATFGAGFTPPTIEFSFYDGWA